MDMSSSYISAAREYLPEIDIVFDRFHVMALMNKAVDHVRKEQWGQLKKEEKQVLQRMLYDHAFLRILPAFGKVFDAFWNLDAMNETFSREK